MPAGYVACDPYWCPAAPACWGGMVVVSGVANEPRHIDCSALHSWQTFVAAPLPAGDVDAAQEDLMSHADVAAICSAENLAHHSHDPTQTTGWTRDALPLKQSDGSWLLICLAHPAGGGEWTGSIT
jgi:serine/threonine-protein kinase